MNSEKLILIAKGTIKHLPGVQKLLRPLQTRGTTESRYCYSVWLRHLVNLNRFRKGVPGVVAELGPGDSLGTGLAALLSGSNRLYTLDVLRYWDNERNLKIFDELVSLFRNREYIPDESEYPRIRPDLEGYTFPYNIIDPDILGHSLADDRLNEIRKEIMDIDNPENRYVICRIPWHDPAIIQYNSIDFIFSQAVLESVEDLENTYYAMSRWLKPGGYMSHTIDFKSHGLTKEWNGHWVFSDFEWYLVKGNRSFLINRQPFSRHIDLHSEYNFEILLKEVVHKENKISRSYLAEPFAHLSEEDITTSGAYLLSRKI